MNEIQKSDLFETGKEGVRKILTPDDGKIDIKDLKQKYEIGINNSDETIGKYVKVFKETLNAI